MTKKHKNKGNENGLSTGGLRYLIGLIVEASESAKDCGQFHFFKNNLFAIFFLEFAEHSRMKRLAGHDV